MPAIIQDSETGIVLMLGFMNAESLDATEKTRKVTFYSRSRMRLWQKGETSGNFLSVVSMAADCDADTILIKAKPHGPVCHTGTDTCFNEVNCPQNFLNELDALIRRRKSTPDKDSYTSELFTQGLNRIAQKVGEEAVELIIAAKDTNDENFKAEAADLLYHLLVLFAEKNIRLEEVIDTLQQRSK